MGVETLAVAGIITATTAATFGTLNYIDSQKAAAAQKSLEDQRATQLKEQAAARSRDEATAAVRGQNFGLRTSFLSSFGFGSGDKASGTGLGAPGNLSGS